MVWLQVGTISQLDRTGKFLSYRTFPGAIRVLPGQAVLCAGGAYDVLGILIHIVALAFPECVLLLRINVVVAEGNDVQFVGADAAVEEFLPPGLRVEVPLAGSLYNGHGERPVLVADHDKGTVPVIRVQRDILLFASLGREIGSPLPVLWKLTSKHNVVPIRTENSLELRLVELVGRIDERGGSLLWSIKPSGAGGRTRG